MLDKYPFSGSSVTGFASSNSHQFENSTCLAASAVTTSFQLETPLDRAAVSTGIPKACLLETPISWHFELMMLSRTFHMLGCSPEDMNTNFLGILTLSFSSALSF